MIMIGIPDGLLVHGIDGGKTMPSWNTLRALMMTGGPFYSVILTLFCLTQGLH
jgi:hypothetical protein